MALFVGRLAVSFSGVRWSSKASAVLVGLIFVSPIDLAHLLHIVVEEIGASSLVNGRAKELAKVLVIAQRRGDHVPHLKAAEVVGVVPARLVIPMGRGGNGSCVVVVMATHDTPKRPDNKQGCDFYQHFCDD